MDGWMLLWMAIVCGCGVLAFLRVVSNDVARAEVELARFSVSENRKLERFMESLMLESQGTSEVEEVDAVSVSSKKAG